MVAPDGKSWNFWRENPRQLGMPHTLECTWLGQGVFHQIWGKGSERHSSLFSLKSNASLIGEVLLEFGPGTSPPPSRRFRARKPITSASRSSRLGMSMSDHVRSCPLVAVLTCGYAHCGCGPRKVLEVCFSIHSHSFPLISII